MGIGSSVEKPNNSATSAHFRPAVERWAHRDPGEPSNVEASDGLNDMGLYLYGI